MYIKFLFFKPYEQFIFKCQKLVSRNPGWNNSRMDVRLFEDTIVVAEWTKVGTQSLESPSLSDTVELNVEWLVRCVITACDIAL